MLVHYEKDQLDNIGRVRFEEGRISVILGIRYQDIISRIHKTSCDRLSFLNGRDP